MSNSSIWPIDRTLSSATTPGQSRPGSNGNERVLHIPQSITGALPSDCLVSYPGHLLAGALLLCRKQLMYYTASANRATLVEGGVLYFCRDAIGVFLSLSPWLDYITLSPNGPETNGNEVILHILQAPRLKLYHQMQFNAIPRTLKNFKYCYLTLIILFNIIYSFALN